MFELHVSLVVLAILVGLLISPPKLGTRSLLFGVHQFVWHPITVARAWRQLYGEWPNFRETVCIIVHDWGYWGCETMDGDDGKQHPELGAKIAWFLFGFEAGESVLFHSRSYAKQYDHAPSRLCWADKFSMIYDPTWFYLIRARLSGEILEYRKNAARDGFLPMSASDRTWYENLTAHLGTKAIDETTASYDTR